MAPLQLPPAQKVATAPVVQGRGVLTRSLTPPAFPRRSAQLAWKHSMPDLKDLLKEVAELRRTLTRDEARLALHTILTSDPDPASDLAIAGLLSAMAARGETIDELTGFAEAMRALSLPIPL